MSDGGTEPPIKLTARGQWFVVVSLSVWLAVAVVSGLVFLFAVITVTPQGVQEVQQSPQQVIPDRNHFPQER